MANTTSSGKSTTAAEFTTSPSLAKDGQTEVEQLREENRQLRQELKAAREGRRVAPAAPTEPSFGICEGSRQEIEDTGTATSPFTGAQLASKDLKSLR